MAPEPQPIVSPTGPPADAISHSLQRDLLRNVLGLLGCEAALERTDGLDWQSSEDVLPKLGLQPRTVLRTIGLARFEEIPCSVHVRLPQPAASPFPPNRRVVSIVIGKPLPRRLSTAVSSRLGRSLDRHRDWFAALRAYCCQVEAESGILMSPAQFTFRFLERWSQWLPFHRVGLWNCGPRSIRRRWLESLSFCLGRREGPSTAILEVSSADLVTGQADAAVAELCDEVRVLHVRPQGNIERLLLDRLEAKGRSIQRTLIHVSGAEFKPQVSELLRRGGIAWHVHSADETSRTDRSWPGAMMPSLGRVIPLTEVACDRYVAHFTRSQPQGWRDESEAARLDALIFGHSHADRGVLSTLMRIIAQRCLLAGNALTRDSSRVVCFTGRSLAEFEHLRKFRSHLSRWDYEPYGIAIDREALRAAGGRPVRYGGEPEWVSLRPAERPFFQRSGGESSDWTGEAEWRVLGDLDLSAFGPDQVLVFAADLPAAGLLASLSPWPVVNMAAKAKSG
jgi:hypothetical protein